MLQPVAKPRKISRPQARNELKIPFSGGVYAGKTLCAERTCDFAANADKSCE
jgi:hypothetical protein